MNTDLTFGELFQLYFDTYAKLNCARPKELHRAFELYFTQLRDVRVLAITRPSVQQWVNGVIEMTAAKHPGKENIGRATAQRQFNQLRAVLRWGEKMYLYQLNPDPTMYVVTPRTRQRKDFLKREEYERFSAAICKQSPVIRDFFYILFLTGARKSNVLAMSWDQIDLNLGLWDVPADLSKNDEPLTLVLSERAIKILQERKAVTGSSPWVFPSTGKSGHLVSVGHAWQRIKQLAQIPKLRPHDLRRTVASWMAQEGVSLQVIGDALGHKSFDSTLVYARLVKKPVREAFEKIQEFLPPAS